MGNETSSAFASPERYRVFENWKREDFANLRDRFYEQDFGFGITAEELQDLLPDPDNVLNETTCKELADAHVPNPKSGKFNALFLICGAEICSRSGSIKEKIEGIYSLMDFDKSGDISFDELIILFFCCLSGTVDVSAVGRRPELPEMEKIATEMYETLGIEKSSPIMLTQWTDWALQQLEGNVFEDDYIKVGDVYKTRNLVHLLTRFDLLSIEKEGKGEEKEEKEGVVEEEKKNEEEKEEAVEESVKRSKETEKDHSRMEPYHDSEGREAEKVELSTQSDLRRRRTKRKILENIFSRCFTEDFDSSRLENSEYSKEDIKVIQWLLRRAKLETLQKEIKNSTDIQLEHKHAFRVLLDKIDTAENEEYKKRQLEKKEFEKDETKKKIVSIKGERLAFRTGVDIVEEENNLATRITCWRFVQLGLRILQGNAGGRGIVKERKEQQDNDHSHHHHHHHHHHRHGDNNENKE
eukprot:g3347.t1